MAMDRRIPLPDAAIRIRVSHRIVYDLALKGLLGTPERIGRRLFVSEDAVDRYLAELERVPLPSTSPTAA